MGEQKLRLPWLIPCGVCNSNTEPCINYHHTGWVPCAPSEACSIPVSGYPNVYACGPDIEVCAFDGNFDNNMPTLDGCFAFCQMTTPGAIFVEYSPSGQVCSCITNIEGVLPYNPSVDLYAIGQPRTPSGTPGDCGGRRLNADNSLYGV